MNESKTKIIVTQAVIGALYVALTAITYPISFLGIQFRIAEMLILLCFFDRKNVIGITIGCVLVNLASSIGPIDALFGGLATLISGLSVAFIPYLGIGLILTIGINAFTVGGELYFILHEPFWISVGFVALGETVVLLVAYIVAHVLKHRPNILNALNATQNIDFKW